MADNKQCFGRRPDGKLCQNQVEPGNREFCNRCNTEIFPRAAVKTRWDDADFDKPNTYCPEPVEVPFNSDLEMELDA